MEVKIYWDLFLLGIFLASGPCILYCAPIILPYIAGTKKDIIEGLKSIITFLIARAAAYVILGLLAALIGKALLMFFNRSEGIINYSIGSFIVLLGVITILGKNPHIHLCKVLDEKIAGGNIKAPAILGIAAGILPCPPLLGVLSYIIVKSRSIMDGGILALSFGLGGLVSPLIILGMIAGGIPGAFSRNARIYSIFRIICGAILIIMGFRFIMQGFLA